MARRALRPADLREVAAIGAQVAHYVHDGILLISVPNLVVIGLMVAVFALAVALRLPGPKGRG